MTSQYETVFIMTPVLSEEQMSETVKMYKKILTDGGIEIIFEDNWGLRKLAYPIQKKSTGFYYSVEFKGDGNVISDMEIAFRRDERILRFLTVKLDKHAIAYSIKRRNKSKGKQDEPAPVQSSNTTGQVDKKPQDKEKEVVVNKESQSEDKQQQKEETIAS